MVFNVTFNNISIISWQSVSLVEETGVNHKSLTNFITQFCIEYHLRIWEMIIIQLKSNSKTFVKLVKSTRY